MIRFLSAFTVALLLSSGHLNAQDSILLDRLYASLEDSCAQITYTYTATVSGTKTIGEGSLAVQGGMWLMKGNGVEMWCDSESIWIADPSLKEAVIEPAGGTGNEMANPAVLFAHLQDLFSVQNSIASDDGRAVEYVLVPKSEGDIEYCNVVVSKDNASIRKAEFLMSDGNRINIDVSEMKILPKMETDCFRPSGVFDSSWIVTDMR